MVIALILFLITYVLMLSFQKYRPYIALASALVFVILGHTGLFRMGILDALGAVDYNVLLMIGGTMGTVALFIESRMPALLAETPHHQGAQRQVGRHGSGPVRRHHQRLRGQCGHGADGRPRGPGHLPAS